MPTPSLPAELLIRLGNYDTPTICNAIELFAVRPRNHGYMDQRIVAAFSDLPPMVGFAATATFRSAAPASGDAYRSLEQQAASLAETAGPAVVVFQDLDDPPVAATFGEIMCSAYRAFGAVGLITSGAGRDLDQVRALDFPVFTSGTICSHAYCHIPSTQIPVRVGGVVVQPADLLHGDRNGVTTIPPEIASELPEACEEFGRAEAVVLDYLQGGQVTPKGFASARAECKRILDALRDRVTGGGRRCPS